MEKGRKKMAPWAVLARGIAISLAGYLAGAALLAVLLVRGAMGEGALYPALALLGGVASAAGGLSCARRTALGVWTEVLLCGLGMGVCLVCAGGCWRGIGWTGHTLLLLGCVLAGSVVSGVLGSRKRRKGNRRRRTRPCEITQK